MSAERVLARLRRFLLGLASGLLAGVLVELAMIGHTENPVQWIPFALGGLGLLALGGALLRPSRATLLALRASMALVAVGGLFGMYEHIANNVAFQLEIQPSATAVALAAAGLGGANPVLAPGILTLAAVLAMAATYAHPALDRSRAPAPRRVGGEGTHGRTNPV
jgi:hypothetical protein